MHYKIVLDILIQHNLNNNYMSFTLTVQLVAMKALEIWLRGLEGLEAWNTWRHGELKGLGAVKAF